MPVANSATIMPMTCHRLTDSIPVTSENSNTTSGDIAMIKLTDDYLGIRFTDFLTLLHENGEWRIVNKTFYAHK